MATSRAVALLRRPGQPQQATFLELFFDLVFVLALFRLNQWLFQNLTWSGTFRMLVLLLTLWWVWSRVAEGHRVWAVRADLLRRLGERGFAAGDYDRALALVDNDVERRYIADARAHLEEY